MNFIQIIVYAILAGIIPALIWLGFWLREDSTHPEPKRRIFYVFCIGALMVLIALPFEYAFQIYIPPTLSGSILIFTILSAMTEEILKFLGAYIGAFRSPDFDEPIDAVTYMTTAALGFSALENIIFVAAPLIKGGIINTIVTINLRFIGASLLHIAASGIVGLCLGFAFYKPLRGKILWVCFGLVLATSLHAFFNFFILKGVAKDTLIAFGTVWLVIIVLILLIEKVKSVQKS